MAKAHEGLEASLLGLPRFRWQGKELILPTEKSRALLCYLVAGHRKVSRKELAELLWGSVHHAVNLRQEVSKLRHEEHAKEAALADGVASLHHPLYRAGDELLAAMRHLVESGKEDGEDMADRKIVIDTDRERGQLFKVSESGGRFYVYDVDVGLLWNHQTKLGEVGSLQDAIELIKASVSGAVRDVKIEDW